jgi:hypothetical protein
MTCPLDLNALLQQARAIRPDVRYITVEFLYGTLGCLPEMQFYAFAGNVLNRTSVCFESVTADGLMNEIRASITPKGIRASLPEAVNA